MAIIPPARNRWLPVLPFLLAVGGAVLASGCGSGNGNGNGNVVIAPPAVPVVLATDCVVTNPVLQFDRAGGAFLVWEQQSPGKTIQVYARRFTPAGGWEAPVSLAADNATDYVVPEIAVDGAGNAIAVWYESPLFATSSGPNVWESRYVAAAGRWETAQKVAVSPGAASRPKVAVSSGGAGVAVWYQNDNVTFLNEIWSSRYTPGAGWDPAVRLNPGGAFDAYKPQIVVSPSDNNAVAVWHEGDGQVFRVRAARLDAGAGWEPAVDLETDNGGDAGPPAVAMDNAGNAVAFWQKDNSVTARSNAWASRFTPGGGWSAPVRISDDIGRMRKDVHVGMNGAGVAVAVWAQTDGTVDNVGSLVYFIWANRFSPVSGWSGAVQVDTDNTHSAIRPYAAVDRSGNAVAAWEKGTATGDNEIWASRYTAGGGWGAPFRIGTAAQGDNRHVRVVFDPGGNAFATWDQTDGGTARLLLYRF